MDTNLEKMEAICTENTHLQPNDEGYHSLSVRSRTPTQRSISPMMSCVPPRSATPGPPTRSQRATSLPAGSVPVPDIPGCHPPSSTTLETDACLAPRDEKEQSHLQFKEHFLENEIAMKKNPVDLELIGRGYSYIGVFQRNNYAPLRAVLFQVLTCCDIQKTVLSLYSQESVLWQLQAHEWRYASLLEAWGFGNNTEFRKFGTPIQSLQQCIRTFFATVDRVSREQSPREKRALLLEEMSRKMGSCPVDLMLMECVKFLMFSLAEKCYTKQAPRQKVPEWFTILNISNKCDSFDEYFHEKLNKYGDSLCPDQGELSLVGASLNVRVKLFDLNMLEAEHFEMIYPTLCYRGPNLQISICTCDYRCYAVMYKSDIITVPKLSTTNSFCSSVSANDVGLCPMGGYDFQFCVNIHGYNCSLCNKVMREPIQIPCGHHYCKSCISHYMENNVNCHSCGREIVSFNFIPDTHMSICISKLIVRCPNSRCSYSCPLSAIENHLQMCTMDSVGCEYRGELIEVEYLSQQRDPFEFKCQKMPRSCPYGCPQTFTLEELNQHLKDNAIQHAQCHQGQLFELMSENDSLKKQLDPLKMTKDSLSEENRVSFHDKVDISMNGVVILVIPDFKHTHPYADNHSQPFYTSPQGFKLRCYVQIVDNCVLVFIERLEGRFDAILSNLVISNVQITIINKKQPQSLDYDFPFDHVRLEQICPMELDFKTIKEFLGESESAVLVVTVVPVEPSNKV